MFTIAFALLLPLSLLGCPSNSNKPIDMAPTNSPAKSASDFDGNRAFEHVRKQVEFGPRPAGSAELEKTRGYIVDQLKSYGLNVTTDEFHPITPQGEKKMVNINTATAAVPARLTPGQSHQDGVGRLRRAADPDSCCRTCAARA